ncbi:MAG: OmpA family protein [Pseudomonadota bacterium]
MSSQSNEGPAPIIQEGAPEWVVTFGDLMSLLLCFFVLLLSFSEMDRAKYKEVAGSLAKAFGVQRKTKAFEAPKGLKMIAKDFDQELIPTQEREEFVVMQMREEIGRELKKAVETNFKGMKDLIDVDVNNNNVTIRLMGESTFESGKAEILQEMMPLLDKIGDALRSTNESIIIAGHTDNVPLRGGRYQSNLGLSIARAATVAEYLIQKNGLDPSRLATMGFGEFRPLAENDTTQGRQQNRRVEIILGAFPQAGVPEGPIAH